MYRDVLLKIGMSKRNDYEWACHFLAYINANYRLSYIPNVEYSMTKKT
jgi:succinate dehydrogenase/fumarate reductase flavoprotein subunit